MPEVTIKPTSIITTENSVFARLAGVTDCRTLQDWQDNLSALESVTFERLQSEYPDAPPEDLRTWYNIHLMTCRYMRNTLDTMEGYGGAFESTMQDPDKVHTFLRNIKETDIPKILFNAPVLTDEQIAELQFYDEPLPQAPALELLNAIRADDMETATELFNRVSFADKITMFVRYSKRNSTALVPQVNPFRNITVPLGPITNSMYSNQKLPLGKSIVPKGGTPAYVISGMDDAENAITDIQTGKTVCFSEFDRAVLNVFATLYDHPRYLWGGYPAMRIEDVYQLLIDDEDAKVTDKRRADIEQFIRKHTTHRVNVDFSRVSGSALDLQIETPLLDLKKAKGSSVIDPTTGKPVEILYFIAEPAVLTLAKASGNVLQSIPRTAYALPKGVNGSPRNIAIVSYLNKQIKQKLYTLSKGNDPNCVIRLDPIYETIEGKTRPETRSRMRKVIASHMNRLCKASDESFPELCAWCWIDKDGKKIKDEDRKRGNNIYALRLTVKKKELR